MPRVLYTPTGLIKEPTSRPYVLSLQPLTATPPLRVGGRRTYTISAGFYDGTRSRELGETGGSDGGNGDEGGSSAPCSFFPRRPSPFRAESAWPGNPALRPSYQVHLEISVFAMRICSSKYVTSGPSSPPRPLLSCQERGPVVWAFHRISPSPPPAFV